VFIFVESTEFGVQHFVMGGVHDIDEDLVF
jgi:hypothetical protein